MYLGSLSSNKLGVAFKHSDDRNTLIIRFNIEKELRGEKELGRTLG
ncbi:MAG: hypothetical protein ACFFCQ_07730 [Promethearchaeota archaeon]